MLAVVILMLVWMTPEVITLGRRLDFVARDSAPPELGRFWIPHAAFTIPEVGKLGAAGVVAVLLSVKRPSENCAILRSS